MTETCCFLRKPKSGLSTIKSIIDEWEKLDNKPRLRVHHRNMIYKLPTDEKSVIIRWGCTDYGDLESKHPTLRIINSVGAIRRTSNKASFRVEMERNNIRIPKTFYASKNISSITKLDDLKGRIIVRPTYHQQGKNVAIFQSVDQYIKCAASLEKSYRWRYISEVIDKEREYRVYFADGHIIAISEKVPKDDKSKKMVIWNSSTSRSFAYRNLRWKEWENHLCMTAMDVIRLSELDFGAIDIMEKDGDFYVLEVNTSIGIESPYRASLFAKILNRMVMNEKMVEFDDKKINKNWWKLYIHPIIRQEAIKEKEQQ